MQETRDKDALAIARHVRFQRNLRLGMRLYLICLVIPGILGGGIYFGGMAGWIGALGVFLIAGLFACVPLWIIDTRLRRGAQRVIVRHEGLVCPHCQFLLAGLGHKGTCPECGKAYEIAELVKTWNDQHDARLTFDRGVPPPPETSGDLPRVEKAPWASWSFSAATIKMREVAAKDGFAGPLTHVNAAEMHRVQAATIQQFPADLASFHFWIDLHLWNTFIAANAGERNQPDAEAHLAAIFDDSADIQHHQPITLPSPSELRRTTLTELAAERTDLKAFLDGLSTLGRPGAWADTQMIEFAFLSDGRSLYYCTDPPDLKRGSIVTFSPGCTDRVWLADSLSQWLLRVGECDGREPALFPRVLDQIPEKLRAFWKAEFAAMNPHYPPEASGDGLTA